MSVSYSLTLYLNPIIKTIKLRKYKNVKIRITFPTERNLNICNHLTCRNTEILSQHHYIIISISTETFRGELEEISNSEIPES